VERTVWNHAAAAVYDDSTGREFDPAVIDQSVEVLARLAGDGAALEFAVGTGRLALPLAARGVRVAGVDSSPPMAERLRAKDPDAAIEVTIGDMTNERVGGVFSLVYLVFNGHRKPVKPG